MIRNLTDQKTTAKRFAHDVVIVDLDIVFGYWEERWAASLTAMSEPEREQVRTHMRKFEERLHKVLGNDRRVGHE